MPDKDLASYTLWTWAIVAIMALWGGVSSYLARLRKDRSLVYSTAEMIGEIVICVLFGVVAFLATQGFGYNELVSVSACAVGSHYGTRTAYILEQFVLKKLGIILPQDD